MRFSRRLPANLAPSALSKTLSAAEDAIDLTVSNPTRCGFVWSTSDVQAAFSDPRLLEYSPAPLGSYHVRRVLSRALDGRVPPEQLVATASTSEAYAYILKLFCDPGDTVAVPAPSYPLLHQLAQLEGVKTVPYALGYAGEWLVDLPSLEKAAQNGARVIFTINPNNPTGSCLKRHEWVALRTLCCEYSVPLVSDEVFAPYRLPNALGAADLLQGEAVDGPLTMILGGLSKWLGMPQMKLAWIELHGRPTDVQEALRGFEWIADAYLSVGRPIEVAVERLIASTGDLCAQIAARVHNNRCTAERMLRETAVASLLKCDGGWYALIRVPEVLSDEQWVTLLATEYRVLLHPGFYYELGHDGVLVASLLLPTALFETALQRVCEGIVQISEKA